LAPRSALERRAETAFASTSKGVFRERYGGIKRSKGRPANWGLSPLPPKVGSATFQEYIPDYLRRCQASWTSADNRLNACQVGGYISSHRAVRQIPPFGIVYTSILSCGVENDRFGKLRDMERFATRMRVVFFATEGEKKNGFACLFSNTFSLN